MKVSVIADKIEKELDVLVWVLKTYWRNPFGNRKRTFWEYYQWIRNTLL